MCQYAQWVSPLNPQVDLYTRAAAPPHTRLSFPFARLKNLTQLRIGCAHLEVEQGRKRRPAVPRHDSASCVQLKALPRNVRWLCWLEQA
jgi:hypothetical protein